MLYLLTQCLWERERKERKLSRYQTFADLGCGNGLLVYILTQEGVSVICVYISPLASRLCTCRMHIEKSLQ